VQPHTNVLQVPSLTAHLGTSAKMSSEEDEIGGNLNLVVIAHCIAKALPSPNEAKDLFSCAFHVPLNFLPFVARKNDLYGIHIVRGGTREKLEEYGAVVEVCDLGYAFVFNVLQCVHVSLAPSLAGVFLVCVCAHMCACA